MSFTRNFLDNIELYLTALCVIIVCLLPFVLSNYDYWEVFGMTAIIISVVHGMFFWVIRRRQRQIRHELIGMIQPMLSDRIRNQLMVVLAATTQYDDATNRRNLENAITAANEITVTLDQLSLDSLRRWQKHYSIPALPM